MLIRQAQDLLPLVASGPAPVEFSAFGESPALLLDLASAQGLAEADALARWLPSLACPVIGLRTAGRSDCRQPEEAGLAMACDTVVESEAAAQQLFEQVAARPVAAASFVDLLRVTESMPVAQALSVESSVYATLQGGAEYTSWLAEQHPRELAAVDPGPPVILERCGERLDMTLNRPSSLNAMSVELRDALVEAFRAVICDDELREVHLFGAGRSFSTGGDLREFGTVPDPASGHLIRLLSVPGRFLAAVADRATVHLHGACVGSGIEFPAFAGRVVARPKTWFQLPELSMGLIPGAGGCISIARRIGRQRLAWMGLSGKRIRVELALMWGLVDAIEGENSCELEGGD